MTKFRRIRTTLFQSYKRKALTFIDRENQDKRTKDIYYVYYVLRFHPKKESLLHDLKILNLHREKSEVAANLQALFSRITSEGCLMVEQENGPDDYIFDVRKDAFERFNELIDTLSS